MMCYSEVLAMMRYMGVQDRTDLSLRLGQALTVLMTSISMKTHWSSTHVMDWVSRPEMRQPFLSQTAIRLFGLT